MWFFPINRNWIRNSYIKGRIDEPEEDKKEGEKQGANDKKEKVKDKDIEPNEEASFEEMIKAAVANMKKENANKEADKLKNLADDKPVKSDPRKTDDAPSNSSSYEEMIKRARENLFGNQHSDNKFNNNNNDIEERVIDRSQKVIEENSKEKEKTKQNGNSSTNKELEKAINKAIGGYQEYYNSVIENDVNDDESEEEIVQKEKEVHEADQLLGKLNEFMSSMKSKIEDSKKKALEKKLEVQKRKEVKKKPNVEGHQENSANLINGTNQIKTSFSETIVGNDVSGKKKLN